MRSDCFSIEPLDFIVPGDYAAFVDGSPVAVVERNAMGDFCNSLVDGPLVRLGTSAVVVEGSYT